MIFGNIPPGYSTEPNPALGMNYPAVMPPQGQMYVYNQQTGEQITVPSGSFSQPPAYTPPTGGVNFLNPFGPVDPGTNPFVLPTTNPYALPEQNPFPEVPTNPYLPPTPFQTIPVNTTPLENFSPISFDPTPGLPVGTFNPYQTVFNPNQSPTGGNTTPPPLLDTLLSALSEGSYRYGDAGNAFRSGLLTEDEFRRFQNAFNAYTGTQVGARPFNIGDLVTPASTRSGVSGDELFATTTTPAPSITKQTTKQSSSPRFAAGSYFVVDGQRYDTRDDALRAANALGDSGGVEYYGADGRLLGGRPILPPEERAALQRSREEALAQFQRQVDYGKQRKSDQANLIAQYNSPEYQQSISQDNYFTIDRGNLRGMKFASFEDAKKFLEQYNTAGLEGVTDAYNKDEVRQARQNLGINFASGEDYVPIMEGISDIRSTTGSNTQYLMPKTQDRRSTVFDNAEDAANYLRPLIQQERRAQAERAIQGSIAKQLFNTYADTGEGFDALVKRVGSSTADYLRRLVDPEILEREVSRKVDETKRQFAQGGEVSLKVSDIKRYRLGGPVGTFVERR